MNYEEELGKMGKGWFVLRVAVDKGISIDTSTSYGKESAMNIREYTYDSTKSEHIEMIKYLLDNWSSRISGGSPVVKSDDLKSIAKDILKK